MADKIEIQVIAKGLESVKKDIENLQKEMAKTGKEGEKTAESFSSSWVNTSLKIIAAIAGIKKAMDFSKEGAKIQQSMEATAQQFGISIDKMLTKLRAASAGTIDNANLIESANRAMALNVTTDLDKMSELMAVARARGKAMGLDTTQAFSDIVTGVGRASPLILDNLGIITKGWAEEAKAAGKAFDAQFILNRVLKDGAEIVKNSNPGVLTMAERLQKMSASAKNAGDNIKRAFSAEVVTLIEELNKTTDGFFEDLEAKIVPIRRIFRTISGAILIVNSSLNTVATSIGVLVHNSIRRIEFFQEVIFDLQRAFNGLGKSTKLALSGDLVGAAKAANEAWSGLKKDVTGDYKSLNDFIKFTNKDATDSIKKDWNNTKKFLASIYGEIGDLSVEEISEEEKARREAAKKAIEEEKKRLEEEARLKKEAQKKAEEEERAHQQEIKDLKRQAFDASKTLINDLFSFASDMRKMDLDEHISNLQDKLDAELKYLDATRNARLESTKEEYESQIEALENQNTILDEIDNAQKEKKIAIYEEQKAAAIVAGNEQKANEIQNEIDKLNFVDETAKKKVDILDKQKEAEAAINAEFDQKMADIQKEIDEKIKKEKRKAAKADKAAAIIQSIINTAVAVTSTLAQAPGGAISKAAAATIIGGLGGAQTALIAAKPIPKFAQGTDFAPGGASLVGERGPEIVNLPRGSEVIPNNQITNNQNDNRNVNITVQANDPITFVNELRQTYGLDVFAEA